MGPPWRAAGGPLDNTAAPDAVRPHEGLSLTVPTMSRVCHGNTKAFKTGM